MGGELPNNNIGKMCNQKKNVNIYRNISKGLRSHAFNYIPYSIFIIEEFYRAAF